MSARDLCHFVVFTLYIFHYSRLVPEEKQIRLVHPGTRWTIYLWAHVARHVMLNLARILLLDVFLTVHHELTVY